MQHVQLDDLGPYQANEPGYAIARTTSPRVISPLINAAISETAVTGFDLRLAKGSMTAVKTPRMIVIKYLGYLDTLEKNSPIKENH